ENLRSACSPLSAVKRGLASRQIEIDHVSTAAQARHPLLDHRAAAVGGGGKALIEIRADSQVLPERLAQVLLVDTRPLQRRIELCLPPKPRAHAPDLPIDPRGRPL